EFRAFTGVELTAMTGLPDEAHRAALGFMALLLGAAGLVLLIASVNVAAMLSARALGRRREMAVRAALGAARGRLVRQLLTETLMLFALGALGGIALAHAATGALERLPLPGDEPIVLELSPDVRVLAFALVVALATGLVFGLAPALRAARRDITSRLREGSPASGTRRTLLSNTLVVGQLALSLVLLVAAGLFLRALDRGQRMDPGFDPRGVATTALDTVAWGYDESRGREFYRRLRERAEAMPGVTAVSTSGFLPLAFGSSGGEIEVDGIAVPVQSVSVDRDYFEVLRLPIVRGRAFAAADDQGAPRVAVINETLARRHWPDGNAIGRTFAARGESVRVVGIARDAKYASLTESTPSFVYFSMAQSWSPRQTLLVRTAGDPALLGPALREAIRDLDPALPPPTVTTLERETSVALLPQRVAASVTAALGALGLLLAAVGLYGIMAYSASRRSHEIGVRMALGAHRVDVLRMVVRQGLQLAGMGVLIGLLLAAAATRVMAGLLFGLSPLDAVTFAVTSALFIAVALLASYLPARRAAAADPVAVLRAE
ncbi:MAG TPA: FtsX-like permease family protein, partial [Thermoanaerobaculia bacterium]|nr:FtsX-like permease family protein [Thermoanaerobaculia bacterium]